MYNQIYLLLKEEYFVILIKKFWNLQKMIHTSFLNTIISCNIDNLE